MAKYEPWKEKPTDEQWKELRKYVGWPEGTTDTSQPPMYGHIVDQLRIRYGIYVSVYPHIKTTTSALTFRFQGFVAKMEDAGVIEKEYTYSDLLYYVTIRKLLSKALEWLKEDEKANGKY